MPSDVHIQHSAHIRQAQPKLTLQTNDSVLSEDVPTTTASQAIYKQRYKALREAGFDDDTANKYSSIYSSVNEVIDAILSQSLADHLVIENGHIKNGIHASNGFVNKSNEVTPSNGQHHFNRGLCGDLGKQHFSFEEESSHPREKLLPFTTETNNKQTIVASDTSDLIGFQLKTHQPSLVDPLIGINGHFDNSFKDLRENGHQELGETSQRLREIFGFDVFAHELNQVDQFESLCEVSSKHEQPSTYDEIVFGKFKSTHASEDFRNEIHLFSSDDVIGSNAFSNSLLVTVLKDSLFDSDEIILEDEGVVDQNVVSTSPSASSSGASSLLLDSSSSPSSFSSLSSSISTTPPNALNGFESSPAESGFEETLFGYSVKQMDSPLLNSKTKFDSFAGSDHLDCNDLTRQSVNKFTSLNGNSTNLCSIAENNALDAFDKAFAAFNHEACLEEISVFGSNSSQRLNNNNSNLGFNDQNIKYQKGNMLSYQFNPPQSNGVDILSESSNNASLNHFTDTFDKYLSQSSNDLFNGKNSTNDETGELLSYLNGNQMQHSLFDYEQQNRSSDLFEVNNLKMNKNGPESKADLFGDFYYGQKTNFASFNDCPDSIFNLTSDSSFGINSQSPYTVEFLNQQRTFADIAASNVISSGPKSNNGDHSLGAIGDYKTAKSNPINCSNLSLNSANNYFSLFGNGNTNGSNQNLPFFESNGNGMAKKQSFCVPPQNYRSSLSPMGHKFSSGQMLNEQINFGSQGIRSNLAMNTMMNNGNMANGPEMTGALNCDGSPLNKPTNLMAYKGLWVCNISPEVTLAYLKRRFRRFGHFTGIQTFERRATNGSNIVFVHYDNPYSPVEAIACLHNYTGQDLCADPNEPLKLRFAPSMEQSRAGQLPTLEQARKMIERHGECFNWRLSSGCHRGIRCQLKHVPINKEIDSQPWVKALKKRPNADL